VRDADSTGTLTHGADDPEAVAPAAHPLATATHDDLVRRFVAHISGRR
jgi:hypothetical protein